MNVVKISRVGLLIRRQWLEHYRAYLVGTALLVLSMIFLYAITHHWRDSFSGGVRNGIFLIGLFIGGGLFTSSILNELTNRSRGMWLLTLPASPLDKILTAAFFSLVVYLVVYTLVFLLVDRGYVFLLSFGAVRAEGVDLFRNGFYNFFFDYLSFSGFVTLGSIYFNKVPFVKTMLVMLIMFFAINVGNGLIIQWMTGLPSISSSTPFSGFQYRYNNENVYVVMPKHLTPVISFVFRVIVPLWLWFVSYVRLKEKEL